MDIDDIVSRGLCDVMERSLIESGIDPSVARELARRACRTPVAAATKRVRKTTKKASKKLSQAFKQANAELRTKSGRLRRGVTQSDIARRAHKIAKKL